MAARRSTDGAVLVRTSDVVAFRLRAHHLDERQPAERLVDVAGACGIQNSPPGSALLALNARVQGLTRERFDHLVDDEKALLQTWTMRGAPYLFPTSDAAIFTTGVLPTTEAARTQLIIGVEPALMSLGMGLDETVELIAEELEGVLAHRQLAIGELGQRLAERVAPRLTPDQRRTWLAEGPYAANQPLGEAIVHFCVRILTLRGVVCIASRSQNKAPFVLTEEWLGHRLPDAAPEVARSELLRRYLHCYGPSTRSEFAAWLGVRTRDVDPWWTPLEPALTLVVRDDRPSWLLSDDVDALQSTQAHLAPPKQLGIRLLPPSDPYTQMRDRETIVAKEHRRQVWRTVGTPGTVLARGTIIGTWQARIGGRPDAPATGRTLTLTIDSFLPVPTLHRDQLQAEAEQVALLRGAATARVQFTPAAGPSDTR